MPSAICRKIPYLFFCGASGSCKSDTAKYLAAIQGVKVFSANTTATSIRNQISKLKRTVIEIPPKSSGDVAGYREVESNFCLTWDDIDPFQLKPGKDIYRLFKNGNDRKTDTIMIAGEERGTTMEFRCFSPKVFSSITPFHRLDTYSELARRMIVIPFEKFDISKVENPPEFLQFDSVSWKGLDDEFKDYWDLQRAEEFLLIRPKLSRVKFPFSSDKKGILLDFISTGITCGFWEHHGEAFEDLDMYFEWLDNDGKKDTFTLKGFLHKLSDLELENAKTLGTTPMINPKHIKAMATSSFKDGLLFDKPSNREVYLIMKDIGWKQKEKMWYYEGSNK